MIRPGGDDEAGVARVGEDLGVRRVSCDPIAPAFPVKLLHEREQALHLVSLSDLNELGLALALLDLGSLELAEDLFDHGQLSSRCRRGRAGCSERLPA